MGVVWYIYQHDSHARQAVCGWKVFSHIDFFFFFLMALSSSFAHSVSPLSPNAWWVVQKEIVKFLHPLLCIFSAFGRICTRSEPLSTLWFKTWDRKSRGFIRRFSWVTAESLFLPEKNQPPNHFVFAVADVHILSFTEMQQFLVLKGL